jgi:cytochrome c biogenesis protein
VCSSDLSERAYHFIKLFGFDDTYHSPWFYFLLALFTVNLVACTVQRIRSLTAEKGRTAKAPADVKGLVAAGSGFTATAGALDEVSRRLGASSYRKKELSETMALYEKGSLARYGVVVIHASILAELLGASTGLSAVTGLYRLEVGRDGAGSRQTRKGAAPGAAGVTVWCKDFTISLYPGGQPKEVRVRTSDPRRRGKGREEGRIRVIEPVSYNGVRLYQSSYGTSNRIRLPCGRQGGRACGARGREGRQDPLLGGALRAEVQISAPGMWSVNGRGRAEDALVLRDVERLRNARDRGLADLPRG